MIRQPRPLVHYGMVGRDVSAYQRALYFTGDRKPLGHTGTFGVKTRSGVEHFQARHRLVADGIIGPVTYAHLYPHFDAYARWLLSHPNLPKQVSTADRVVQWCLWMLARGSQVHYLQQRPMQNLVCPPEINAYCDCSEFATNAYKCGGAADPNGYGYDGVGNTSTLQAHGTRISSPRPAALVFYSNPDHVAVAVSSTRVVSHGSEGVYLLDYRYRPVYTIHTYGL